MTKTGSWTVILVLILAAMACELGNERTFSLQETVAVSKASWPPLEAVVSRSAISLPVSELHSLDEDFQGQRYHPVVVSSCTGPEGPEHSGVWVKDRISEEWMVKWGVPPEELEREHLERRERGFEAIEIDAVDPNGNLSFNVVWIRAAKAPPTSLEVGLSLSEVKKQIIEFAKLGIRPTRIDAYHDGEAVLFAVLYVQDWSRSALEANLGSEQLELVSARKKDRGYVAVDLTTYLEDGVVKHAGIWVHDARILDQKIAVDLSSSEIDNLGMFRKTDNMILGDLDSYFDEIGDRRFSAIWHRIYPTQELETNIDDLDSDSLLGQLRAEVNELRGSGVDGKKARVGFRVEDLTNGRYLAFNSQQLFELPETDDLILSASSIRAGVNLDGPFTKGDAELWKISEELLWDVVGIADFGPWSMTRPHSITPEAYSVFLIRLAEDDILQPTQRGTLLATMQSELGISDGHGELYESIRLLAGAHDTGNSVVGMTFDWSGEPGDTTRIAPQYSFCLFTQEWEGGMGMGTADRGIRKILEVCLEILHARRKAE